VEHGQLEDAVKQYQEGEEVLRAALVRTHPEGPRHAIEEELPALYAARAGAERAGATTLATDAFTAAVNDQQELEAVLEAGELTRARELLPKVRAGFAAATTAAVQAKAKRGADAARAVMERARAAARETGADQLVSEEWAEAQALELEGEATEKREHWRRASMLYRAATRGYEDVRVKALRHAEERKLAEAVTAARTAMEAARARAESAGAPTAAAERYAAAAACAQRAADAADDAAGMAAAAADFAQAAEGFDAAAAAAADAERARRSELAKMLATVEEARQHAMEAGAEGHAEFAAATDALAAARRALDAGGLDAVPRLAAEAERAFTVTLGATTEAAEQRAVTARTTAELAGADDDTTTSARDAFRLGEQRREEGALRVAAMAFHDAAASYEAATEACATAAHEGAAAATVAANDARAAEAVELAADAYRTAVAEGEAAAAALATGRFTEAKTAFRVAAQSFRAAAEAATAERDRLDALRTEEVRKAVDAGNAALRTALLAGDGDKVAELYTADAEVIRTGAPIVSGRPAIAEFWKGALGGKVTKLAIEMRTLESSGNLAIASGSIEITNGDRGTSISHSVAVWKREAGSWKLHRDTWSEEGPVAKSG
jgi:ketosteroid isomerase-like protein